MVGCGKVSGAVQEPPILMLPSLIYGIQAFLWVNAGKRPRDLERIKLMRFGYVKQIFDWNDVRPDKSRPYDWSHSDLVVAEANYRSIGVIARLDKTPIVAILPAFIDPNQPPYDLTAVHASCHDLAAH